MTDFKTLLNEFKQSKLGCEAQQWAKEIFAMHPNESMQYKMEMVAAFASNGDAVSLKSFLEKVWEKELSRPPQKDNPSPLIHFSISLTRHIAYTAIEALDTIKAQQFFQALPTVIPARIVPLVYQGIVLIECGVMFGRPWLSDMGYDLAHKANSSHANKELNHLLKLLCRTYTKEVQEWAMANEVIMKKLVELVPPNHHLAPQFPAIEAYRLKSSLKKASSDGCLETRPPKLM